MTVGLKRVGFLLMLGLLYLPTIARAMTEDEKVLFAIQQQDFARLEQLLQSGHNANARDIHLQSALEYAVRNSNVPMAKSLLAHGADVNSQNKGGQTALMKAVANNDAEMVRFLLGRGADAALETYDGVSCRDLAFFKHASAEVIALLEAAGRPRANAVAKATSSSLAPWSTKRPDSPAPAPSRPGVAPAPSPTGPRSPFDLNNPTFTDEEVLAAARLSGAAYGADADLAALDLDAGFLKPLVGNAQLLAGTTRSRDGRKLYLVAVRGTEKTLADWTTDFFALKVPFSSEPYRGMKGKVHDGFLTYAASVHDQLRKRFPAMVSELRADAGIVLTGHSLGGAAAIVEAALLAHLEVPRERMKVIVFGAPMPGDHEFAWAYQSRMNLVRVINAADPVAEIGTLYGGEAMGTWWGLKDGRRVSDAKEWETVHFGALEAAKNYLAMAAKNASNHALELYIRNLGGAEAAGGETSRQPGGVRFVRLAETGEAEIRPFPNVEAATAKFSMSYSWPESAPDPRVLENARRIVGAMLFKASPRSKEEAQAAAVGVKRTFLASFRAYVADLGKDAAVGDYRAYEFSREWNRTLDVEHLEGGILTVRDLDYEYTGGAHGNYSVSASVHLLEGGKEIALNDIFAPGFESTLEKIVSTNAAKTVDSLQGDVRLINNFTVSPLGITFIYQPYEIASYANGAPEVFVGWGDLKPLLKNGGPLWPLIAPQLGAR